MTIRRLIAAGAVLAMLLCSTPVLAAPPSADGPAGWSWTDWVGDFLGSLVGVLLDKDGGEDGGDQGEGMNGEDPSDIVPDPQVGTFGDPNG